MQKSSNRFLGPGIEMLPEESIIRKNHHGEIYGTKMYNISLQFKDGYQQAYRYLGKLCEYMPLVRDHWCWYYAYNRCEKAISLRFLNQVLKLRHTHQKRNWRRKSSTYLKHNIEREQIAKAGQDSNSS